MSLLTTNMKIRQNLRLPISISVLFYLSAFAAFSLILCAGSATANEANEPVIEETIVFPDEENDSVELETDPTEPVIEPTESVTEPTESVSDTTESVTEPTESVSDTTESVVEEPTIIGFGKAGIAYLKKTFARYVYVGECPGRTDLAYFDSQKLLVSKSDETVPEPAEGMRVRIFNQNNSAYSDRRWEPQDQNSLSNYYQSQGLDIAYGTAHSNRYFNLESGNNDITVAFYKEALGLDSEVARMNLNVDVAIEETQRERNREYGPSVVECSADRKLSENLITDENCPGTRERVRYLQCPQGTRNGLQATREVESVLAGPESGPIIRVPGVGEFEWPF